MVCLCVNEHRNSTFSSNYNPGADYLTGAASGSEGDAEQQSLSEGSVSDYRFGIGEDFEYTEPNPPTNQPGQGLDRAPNGSSLGHFQEHLASEENLAATEEPQEEPEIPAEGPPPYAPYAPIDPTGTHIFPPRPPGFYNHIYHNPRSINSGIGPDAIEVRGIYIPEGLPSYFRGNFGLPLTVDEIYHAPPGQERFEYLQSGLADGTFTRWSKEHSVPTSRFLSWLKGLNPFKKSRNTQANGTETDPDTSARPSETWFQRWKRGHNERSRIRREAVACIEAQQGG